MDSDQITIGLDDDFVFDNNTVTVANDWNWAVTSDIKHNPGIELHGEGADIVINGVSLTKTLQGLNDRLAILQVNPELEAEFDELHALGEQYRALERKLLEKKAVWDALNGN